MRVAAWMRRHFPTVDAERSLHGAEILMRGYQVRHLPVVEGRRLVGMLAEEDLEAARPSPATTLLTGEVLYRLAGIRVREVMTPEVISVGPSTPLAQAARLMRDRDLGALPVLKDGEPVGILTEAEMLELLESLLRDDGDADDRFPEEI